MCYSSNETAKAAMNDNPGQAVTFLARERTLRWQCHLFKSLAAPRLKNVGIFCLNVRLDTGRVNVH
jgi:hypothetical protein